MPIGEANASPSSPRGRPSDGRGADIDDVGDEPAGEERGRQRKQPHAEQPRGDEELRRRHRREREEPDHAGASPTVARERGRGPPRGARGAGRADGRGSCG
jgi:hypothetical protein